MPYQYMDDSVVFAVDAAIKSSHVRKLDQNSDHLIGLMDSSTGHGHGGGTDDGGPLAVASVTLSMLKFTEDSYSYSGNGPVDTYKTVSRYVHGHYASVTNSPSAGYTVTGPEVDLSTTGTKEPRFHIVFNNDGSGIALTIYWPYHSN